MSLRTSLPFAAAFLVLVTGGSRPPLANADDWPQWMGPKRDNVWRETGLVETLPAKAKIVWRVPVAGGYSGPSVAKGLVYVTDFATNDDVKIGNFERNKSTGTERIHCFEEG